MTAWHHITVSTWKWVCWVLLILVCGFHFFSDGRNSGRMQELRRTGGDLSQIHWLCARLNIAAIALIILIIVLGIISRRALRVHPIQSIPHTTDKTV